MSVKTPGTSTAFRGILAIGNTQSEAVNRYRSLALGKGVAMFTDESRSNAFISSSASGTLENLFNPETGDMDIVQANDLLTDLEFESKSSEVEVNHFECTAGCGAHLVYDDESLVKHCPVCASTIEEEDVESEVEDETDDEVEDETDFDSEDESESSDESDDEVEDESDESDESDDEVEDESDESDDEVEDESDDEVEDESDDEVEDESDDEVEDESDDEEGSSDEPLVIAADNLEAASKLYVKHKALASSGVATASSDHDVDYCICTSATCGAHILSDETVDSCPACDADVREPRHASLAAGNMLSYSADLEDEEADLGTDITSDEDDFAVDSDDADSDVDTSDDEVADEDSDEDDSHDDSIDDEDEDEIADEDEDDATTEVDVDSSDDIDDETSESSYKNLDVAYCGTLQGGAKWLALYNGNPVASISHDQAGKNKDVFNTATFGQIVIASAKHVGVRASLKELGFTPFIRTISISSIVNSLADEKIEQAAAAVASTQSQYQESLQAALATAAVGLNRGFFVNMKNPLKDAFHDAFATAGVRNPATIIANVFRNHADEYHQVLLAKATEIMSKPAEVQESLAMTVLETQYSESTSNNGVATVDDALGNMGTVVASTIAPVAVTQQQQQFVASDKVAAVVSGLGRRR